MNFIKTEIRMVSSDKSKKKSPDLSEENANENSKTWPFSLKTHKKPISKKGTKNDLFFSFNFNSESLNLKFGSKSLNKQFSVSNDNESNPKFEEKRAKKIRRDTISYNPKDNSIVCTYSEMENIDISRINEIIINVLRDDVKNRNILESKIEKIDLFLSEPCSSLQQKYYIKEKQNIEREISKKDKLYNEYHIKTKNILEDSISNKTDLVEQFLDITSDYVRYDLIKKNKKKNICVGCGINIDEIVVLSGSVFVCHICGCENTSFNKVTNNTNQNTGTKSKKRKNDKNFENAYLRYIGEQNIKLPGNLEEKLDNYFKHVGFSVGSEVKKIELVDDETKLIRPGTSIDKMIEALKGCNLNEYYIHVRYICRVYWGWVLKNYDNLKDELLFRYQVTSSKYDSIKKGSSSLNMNFHLLKLFRTMSCPCKPNDFKKVKVPSTIKDYEVYWKKIIKKVKEDDDCAHFNGKLLHWE